LRGTPRFCLATNYTGRIIRSAEKIRSVPVIVCALEDAPSDGEPLSTHNERMRPTAKPKMKLWALLAVVVIAVAVLAWLWLAKTPERADKTGEPSDSSISTGTDALAAESQSKVQIDSPQAVRREQTVAPPQPGANTMHPNAREEGADP
jgi:hypothetical protein